MENLGKIQGLKIKGLEDILSSIFSLLNVLVITAKFLFLTPVGWVLIILGMIIIIFYKSKNKKGEITVSGLLGGTTETLFRFYSNITTILLGIVLLILITVIFNLMNDVSKSLYLYRDIKTLEATLKNLKTERKLIEVNAIPDNNQASPGLTVKIKYFSYSPVKDADISTGDASYTIPGKKIYVDFGLINFDYSLVEKAAEKNIAFPDKIFTETISPENGLGIFNQPGEVPLTFKLDNQDLFSIEQNDYNREINSIVEAVSNTSKAKKLGIRTSYGEAIGIYPDPKKTYTFYSTAIGGIVLR